MTIQHHHNPNTGEWNDSLVGEFLWSNVNVSEAVPDVMTPSTWSLWQIYHYEATSIKLPANYPFCGNICGRPYLNLSLFASLYKAIGQDFRKELVGEMVGSAQVDMNIPILRFSPISVLWTTLPGMIKAQRYATRDQHKVPKFVAETPDWCRSQRMKIKSAQDQNTLSSLWLAEIRPYFLQACWLLRSVTMLFSDPAVKLRLDLTKLIGETDANTIMSNLAGRKSELESLGPVLGLAQVVNGKMTQEDYMRRYGHRSPHEMELFACGSDEDPAWFEKLLADFTRSPADVEGLLAKQRSDMENVWGKFQAKYPREAKKFQQRLNQVATASRNREAVRSEMTRIARLIRQFLLRAGEVTGIGDGVFFLSLTEMTEMLDGNKSSITYIPERCETYSKYSSLPPYPAIIIGKFDPFKWAADPNHRSDYFDSRTSERIISNVIKGFAGAAGCVEGIVRRIDRAEDGNQILPGEILVTVTTNVGWTPLFPRLSAIVTDVGAPLSHAAIVAREMGIPAVVGCGNATMLLKTGDRVRVDGSAGTVEILNK